MPTSDVDIQRAAPPADGVVSCIVAMAATGTILRRRPRIDDVARIACIWPCGVNGSTGWARASLRRWIAHFVASIFRGVAPGELPIETPKHFELSINLKTARAR